MPEIYQITNGTLKINGLILQDPLVTFVFIGTRIEIL